MHGRTVNPTVCKLIPLIASDKTSWSPGIAPIAENEETESCCFIVVGPDPDDVAPYPLSQSVVWWWYSLAKNQPVPLTLVSKPWLRIKQEQEKKDV